MTAPTGAAEAGSEPVRRGALRGQAHHRRSGQPPRTDGRRLLTGGHILVEGVPGLAKTLAVSRSPPRSAASSSGSSSRRTWCPPT